METENPFFSNKKSNSDFGNIKNNPEPEDEIKDAPDGSEDDFEDDFNDNAGDEEDD